MPRLLGSTNVGNPLSYCPKAPASGTPTSQIGVVDGGLRRPWQMSSWEGSLGFNGYLYTDITDW